MRVSDTIFRSPLRVQQRDHRVEVRDRVDLAGAHRRDRAAAGADADDRDVARLQADLGEHEVGEARWSTSPAPVTPSFLPFSSATDLKFGIVFGLTAEHDLRRAGPAARRRAAAGP
jgi:hypothetical protein